jgi:peptidoglycan-N-acetylglucosamine deacetylase
MADLLQWLPVILLLVYWIIPEFMTYVLGWRVFRKSSQGLEIAFTFDDGPDPHYTPRLLDLLKEFHMKATFFVLGSKAEKYPELILRMHQEGHLIGIHHYVHRANWVMTPWTIRRELHRCASILQRITGVRPVYFRPPWGLLNLFDLFLQKQFQFVMWSVMAGDWRKKGGTEKIKNRLVHRIKGGSVILLHDSGETWGADQDAPCYTINALEELLREGFLQNFNCLRVDELIQLEKEGMHPRVSWKKRWTVSVWLLWEKLLLMILRIKTIDEKRPFLKGRVRIYHGRTIPLPQGEEIKRGDRVLELHLNNEWLFKKGNQSRSLVQLAVQMIHQTEQLLPRLSEFIQNHPNREEIKGVYGITIIHRGVKQFGFTVLDLPKGWFSNLTKVYLRFILRIIHPQGKQRVKTKTDLLIPKVVAISKRELIQRYSPPNGGSLDV